ncbi:MAG: hypothetical protein ACTTJH_01975 [Bacteroidales bacterium]
MGRIINPYFLSLTMVLSLSSYFFRPQEFPPDSVTFAYKCNIIALDLGSWYECMVCVSCICD